MLFWSTLGRECKEGCGKRRVSYWDRAQSSEDEEEFSEAACWEESHLERSTNSGIVERSFPGWVYFCAAVKRCSECLHQDSRDADANICGDEDLPSRSVDWHLDIVVGRTIDPRNGEREDDSDERERSSCTICACRRLDGITAEVFSSSTSCHAPNDEGWDPEVSIQAVDPRYAQHANDPDSRTNNNDTSPLRELAIR